MSPVRAFVVGMGAVSPAGKGCQSLHSLLDSNTRLLKPLRAFPAPEALPAGHSEIPRAGARPRSHELILQATTEALQGCSYTPQSVVLGGTTGGIDVTEDLLRQGVTAPAAYAQHGTGTVAEEVASMIGCPGPAMTVSTACSSGAAALKVALDLLRSGDFQCLLAGGVDALCRLTYHGFKSLQLMDPEGAAPFDFRRRGMSVGEGAACLILVAGTEPPPGALAELAGCGLSCDAAHPTAPHPQGLGAELAMQLALQDAGLGAKDIDYVNMHGTGTKDGDLSESHAFCRVFSGHVPPASSIKGALGHSLGASGALEAVVSVLALNRGYLPGTAGCRTPDPELGWKPLVRPVHKKVRRILSNSFGFGGNNAAVVLRCPEKDSRKRSVTPRALAVKGAACLTGAGDCTQSLSCWAQGQSCAGTASEEDILNGLDSSSMRRMKRLSRIALSLAAKVLASAGEESHTGGIFWGTGWGPLSETYDFLSKLEKTGDKFSSPTDFMGSVHNAPAGYMAIQLQCRGPNVTCTAGDVSFEQALYLASRMSDEQVGARLIAGADEYHHHLTPLLDPGAEQCPADGGGALLLTDAGNAPGPRIFCSCLQRFQGQSSLISLVDSLQEEGALQERFGAVWLGLSHQSRHLGVEQLQDIVQQTGFHGPVVDYRPYVGEFATAAAAATVLALKCVENGYLPGAMLAQRQDYSLQGKGIVLLGLGKTLSCIQVVPGSRAK